LLFLKHLNLGAMKAIRIKTFDRFSNLNRFEIVLIKDVVFQNLAFFVARNEGHLDLKLQNGTQFELRINCDQIQFEKFKVRWERFKANDDYYFDLSDWNKQ
jgi:hypothetical protein